MVLIIDNYDSFTYNLVHLVGGFTRNISVIRNDDVTLEELEQLPSLYHLIISSGSVKSRNLEICKELILNLKGKVPILGIGLGHLAICEAFGGEIVSTKQILHGKQSSIHIANGSRIFENLPPLIQAARYHSHVVDRKSINDGLLVIAEDDEGEVMGIKHREYEIYGLQFNPESIMTPKGELIIRNFLHIGGEIL